MTAIIEPEAAEALESLLTEEQERIACYRAHLRGTLLSGRRVLRFLRLAALYAELKGRDPAKATAFNRFAATARSEWFRASVAGSTSDPEHATVFDQIRLWIPRA